MSFKWPFLNATFPEISRTNAAIYVCVALLSGFGLSLVFASGPLVQAIAIAFLSGQAPSLYDGENVGQIVDASTYMKAALWPPYLIAGLLSAIAMIQSSKKKSFVIWGTLTIGASLTTIDAFTGGPEGLFICAICNFSAGFLLAVFTLVLVLNSKATRRLSGGKASTEIALWILTPFMGYSILAGVLFFVLSFLTTIPSTPASFRLEPPINGYYVTSTTNQCKNETLNRVGNKCRSLTNMAVSDQNSLSDVFSVLGDFSSDDDNQFEFVGGGKELTFEWHKKITGDVTGSVWVTQGCVDKGAISGATKSKPIFHGLMKDLRISIDEGLSEFRMIEPKSRQVEVNDNNIAQFWIGPVGGDAEHLKISRFLSNGEIRVSDNYDTSTFELGLFPLTGNEKGPTFKSRQITVSINDNELKKLNISVKSKLVSPGANMICAPLQTQVVADSLSASATAPYVSLIISIEPPKLVNLEEVDQSNEAVVSGANGWIENTGLRKVDLYEAIDGGNLSQLSVIGSVKDLVIDGQTIPSGQTSTLQLSGKFMGRSDGPAILLEGKADDLILNGRRLTTTRWERLDAGVRIPIILGVPTAAYFLLNFAIATLRRRTRKVWRLPTQHSNLKQ